MDIKTRILSWQHAIGENPAILVLVIISAIAIIFLSAMYIDSYLKYRKKKKHKRGPN